MAAFGIIVSNPGSEWVVTSETFLPAYLGRATYVSTTQATHAGAVTGAGGFSTYTFTFAGPIVPVLPLAPGYRGVIYSVVQAGSTWTIKVSYSDGTQHSDTTQGDFTMYVQSAPPAVFVFGIPATPAGAYGLTIYTGAGQLAADLSRFPLMLAAHATLAIGSNSVSGLPSLTLPGLVGRSTDYASIGGPSGTPSLFRVRTRMSCWAYAGGTLSRLWDTRRLFTTDDPGSDIVARLDLVNVWLTECSGLP